MSKISETDSKSEEPSTSSHTLVNGKDTKNKTISGLTNTSDVRASNSGQGCRSDSSVKRKFRSLTFGRRKKSLECFANNKCKQNNCNNKETNNSNTSNAKKKKSSSVWAFKLCARTDSCADVTQVDKECDSCVCTAYKKTEEPELNGNGNGNGSDLDSNVMYVCNNSCDQTVDRMHNNCQNESNTALTAIPVLQTIESNDSITNNESLSRAYVDSGLVSYGLNGVDSSVGPYANQSIMSEVRSVQVRVSELALALRSQLAITVSPYPYLARWGEVAELTPGFLNRFCIRSDSSQALNEGQQIHTQIDYIHCLVPDLLSITNCSFYWGKIDRYEAERLLDNKPEGTFLLRDSAQEEHLFSVSFRRFDRSLHARIEQWNHRFSFDSHDPGVFASSTVCGLIEHYKDPSHCMFFEPMLTIPLHRNFTFSLQHLSRAAITSRLTYDTIHLIQLPKRLKNYLKEYHYKQQVRVRRLDGDH